MFLIMLIIDTNYRLVEKDLSLPIFNSSVTYSLLPYIGKFVMNFDPIRNKIIWKKDLVIRVKLEGVFNPMNVTLIFKIK